MTEIKFHEVGKILNFLENKSSTKKQKQTVLYSDQIKQC